MVGKPECQPRDVVVLQVAPHARASSTGAMPCAASTSPGPMPESCSRCGEPIAPAASTTPKRARSSVSSLPRRTSTPTARPVLHHHAQRHRVADHGQVRPRQRGHEIRARGRDTPLPRRVCWNVANPSRRGRFMSAFTGRPIASPRRRIRAAGRASRQVLDRLRAGVPRPSPPPAKFSWRMKYGSRSSHPQPVQPFCATRGRSPTDARATCPSPLIDDDPPHTRPRG